MTAPVSGHHHRDASADQSDEATGEHQPAEEGSEMEEDQEVPPRHRHDLRGLFDAPSDFISLLSSRRVSASGHPYRPDRQEALRDTLPGEETREPAATSTGREASLTTPGRVRSRGPTLGRFWKRSARLMVRKRKVRLLILRAREVASSLGQLSDITRVLRGELILEQLSDITRVLRGESDPPLARGAEDGLEDMHSRGETR